jgi:lipopolysaccharide/colanic/teichoic acid biosynthesis glycosyltransferase
MQESKLEHIPHQLLADNRSIYLTAKRLLDLLIVVVGLIIAAPLMLLIMLCIRLDSKGPVFFRQQRSGRDGQLFTLYKFRTMCHNADPALHRRYVEQFIHNRGVDGQAATTTQKFKLTHDPRITRVGHVLRRTSLDELPQLFNVLKGDMSMVGPRPPLPYEVDVYEEWHKGRLAASPGITGPWQVRGRSRVMFDDMVQMDLEYIAQKSLWLDIKILLLTIPAVISGNGAE